MNVITTTKPEAPQRGLAQLRPASVAYPRAFIALLHRDLHVLSKHFVLFLIRTIMQPLLLVFVFTYVFPIAAIVPATPVDLKIHWPILLTLAPLAGWVAAALGLVLGTRVAPQNVSYLFALVVLPLTFLGAIYYPWNTLEAVRWLQILVLVNPLVYMCEGFRAALTTTSHMSLWAIYGALLGFSALFTWLGINGFKRRVLS